MYGQHDKSELPDFMQGGQYLRLPIQENGQDLYLDLNYLTPWGGIAQMTGEPQNPTFTLIADLARNKSSFTQKEIWKTTDSDQVIKQKIGDYVYKALMPSLAPALPGLTKGGYSFEKIVDAMRGRPDYFDRLRGLPVALGDVLLGLKTTPIDYEETARIKQGTRISKIKDLQTEIRTTELDKRYPHTPSGQQEKQKKIEYLRGRLQQLQAQ
jgi:hypothetical protein